MKNSKLKFIFIGLMMVNLSCFAQPEYTAVKNDFIANAKPHSRDLQKKDDLSFLLTPLSELKLNDKYILSDFRRYWTIRVRESSFLRLYVRKKKQNRPNEDYFDKEYYRYLKCKKNNMPYITNKEQVAFTDPFSKISLTGTKMSIWQAYLLEKSSILFGMRNDANYNQTYLITSVEDVDSIISLIKKSWEDDLFSENFNPNFVDAKGERYKRHVAETFAVVDSLQNLKFKKMEPVFTFDADSVTIEHYAFAEFHGLGKSKTTLFFANRHHHHIKKVVERKFSYISKYSRQIWY